MAFVRHNLTFLAEENAFLIEMGCLLLKSSALICVSLPTSIAHVLGSRMLDPGYQVHRCALVGQDGLLLVDVGRH
jgi:hypothetical protein